MGARDQSQLEQAPSSPDIPLLHYHASLFRNQLLAPICLIPNFFLNLNVISFFLWFSLTTLTDRQFSLLADQFNVTEKWLNIFLDCLTLRSLYQK